MGDDIDVECPDCGGTEFWQTASTLLNMGEKIKYQCASCHYGFVRIDGAVDTARA